MANSYHGPEDLQKPMAKELEEILKNKPTEEGPISRYVLKTNPLIDKKTLKRKTFGKKDDSKPHKTILLLGETGTGKSTAINALVNYFLCVKMNDRIWLELIETNANQTESQTAAVTVYDVYVEQREFTLTLIDTPGYGSTQGAEEDKKVTETLHEMFRCKDGVEEVNAVCLVMSSNTTRLTDRQIYVFDSILSLFGQDVEENIAIFITRCHRTPRNAIQAVKKANIKCAKTDKGEPVYFTFDNSHCEIFNKEVDKEEYESIGSDYDETLTSVYASIEDFFIFLNERKNVSLKMTERVMERRSQLTTSMTNLQERILLMESKKKELDQAKSALKKNEQNKTNFEITFDELYKEKVPTPGDEKATCCRVCEENCHYPGCWWVTNLSWCSVMTKDKCTVCTGKCHYTNHVKEGKIYVLKTRKRTITFEELNKKYDNQSGEMTSLVGRLEKEINEHDKEKVRLIEECYHCVVSLDEMALKTDTVSTIKHIDFLIERVEQSYKMQKLEELKKKSG